MALIRPKSWDMCQTTSMQRLLGIQTFRSISLDNTPPSMTVQSLTINEATSFQLIQMTRPITILTMSPIHKFCCSLHRHSWSTLSALSLQMIRYVSTILCSFTHSHFFSCFISSTAPSFDSYIWSSVGLSSRLTSYTTIRWGKLSSISGRYHSKCWNSSFWYIQSSDIPACTNFHQ